MGEDKAMKISLTPTIYHPEFSSSLFCASTPSHIPRGSLVSYCPYATKYELSLRHHTRLPSTMTSPGSGPEHSDSTETLVLRLNFTAGSLVDDSNLSDLDYSLHLWDDRYPYPKSVHSRSSYSSSEKDDETATLRAPSPPPSAFSLSSFPMPPDHDQSEPHQYAMSRPGERNILDSSALYDPDSKPQGGPMPTIIVTSSNSSSSRYYEHLDISFVYDESFLSPRSAPYPPRHVQSWTQKEADSKRLEEELDKWDHMQLGIKRGRRAWWKRLSTDKDLLEPQIVLRDGKRKSMV